MKTANVRLLNLRLPRGGAGNVVVTIDGQKIESPAYLTPTGRSLCALLAAATASGPRCCPRNLATDQARRSYKGRILSGPGAGFST